MRFKIDKTFALTIYACARQAERSMDRALTSPRQWQLLREYYDGEKRDALNRQLQRLRNMLPPGRCSAARHEFERLRLGWLLLAPLNYWLNKGRHHWRFPLKELLFISATLERFCEALFQNSKPPVEYLVELRMDLATCWCLIGERMMGVAELRQARKVEHFCQPEFFSHVTIDDLIEGVFPDNSGPRISVEKAKP